MCAFIQKACSSVSEGCSWHGVTLFDCLPCMPCLPDLIPRVLVLCADGKPIAATSVSVQSGKTYEQEFALEMEKAKVMPSPWFLDLIFPFPFLSLDLRDAFSLVLDVKPFLFPFLSLDLRGSTRRPKVFLIFCGQKCAHFPFQHMLSLPSSSSQPCTGSMCGGLTQFLFFFFFPCRGRGRCPACRGQLESMVKPGGWSSACWAYGHGGTFGLRLVDSAFGLPRGSGR